jgi:hypothetical protein
VQVATFSTVTFSEKLKIMGLQEARLLNIFVLIKSLFTTWCDLKVYWRYEPGTSWKAGPSNVSVWQVCLILLLAVVCMYHCPSPCPTQCCHRNHNDEFDHLLYLRPLAVKFQLHVPYYTLYMSAVLSENAAFCKSMTQRKG